MKMKMGLYLSPTGEFAILSSNGYDCGLIHISVKNSSEGDILLFRREVAILIGHWEYLGRL